MIKRYVKFVKRSGKPFHVNVITQTIKSQSKTRRKPEFLETEIFQMLNSDGPELSRKLIPFKNRIGPDNATSILEDCFNL